jgi:adenylyl- and sulfurtransferase ThiI
MKRIKGMEVKMNLCYIQNEGANVIGNSGKEGKEICIETRRWTKN